MQLTTTNLAELLGIARQCSDTFTPIDRYRTWVQPTAGGRRLRGVHTQRSRIGGRIPVSIATITRFRGVPTARGVIQPSSGKGAVRCGRQLGACLTEKLRDD
jgi:hypothetical protein